MPGNENPSCSHQVGWLLGTSASYRAVCFHTVGMCLGSTPFHPFQSTGNSGKEGRFYPPLLPANNGQFFIWAGPIFGFLRVHLHVDLLEYLEQPVWDCYWIAWPGGVSCVRVIFFAQHVHPAPDGHKRYRNEDHGEENGVLGKPRPVFRFLIVYGTENLPITENSSKG